MKKFALLLVLIIFQNAYSAVFEFDFDFSYDRSKFGSSRNNKMITRTYSASLASYIFSTTALDFSYSNSEDQTTLTDRAASGITNYDVVGQYQRVISQTYGVGIKQMLAPKDFVIVPMISIGYAKDVTNSRSDITFENINTLVRTTVPYDESDSKTDSLYGAFILQIKVTQRFSLKGSVKTIFPYGDYNKARDNLKFLAGFSWLF